MIGAYYYLAAYTAAIAAGFSPAHAYTIARSARYALSADQFGISDLSLALEYLPEDRKETAFLADPVKQDNPSMDGLALVCGPSGTLAGRAVGWARDCQNGREASRLQCTGIVLCALANTRLHQGFTGLSDEAVNTAADIKIAKTVSQKTLRTVLKSLLEGKALESLVEMEAYTPSQAPDSYLGTAQLSGLDRQPGALYSYQSSWRANPTVDCAGPLRFAKVYMTMRSVLPYIRNGKNPGILTGTEDLIDLACFLANAPEDEADFTSMWWQNFGWCNKGPDYCEPDYSKDRQFINDFGRHLTVYRDFVFSEYAKLEQAETTAMEE